MRRWRNMAEVTQSAACETWYTSQDIKMDSGNAGLAGGEPPYRSRQPNIDQIRTN